MSLCTQSFVPFLAVFQARLDVALRNLVLWKVSRHMAGGWNHVVFKVHPIPNHYMVPWLSEGCRSIWHSQSLVLLLFPRVTQLSKSIPAKHQGRRLFYHLSRNNIAYPAWQTVPWTCLEYPFLYLAHKDTTGENFSKRLMSQKEYILGPKSGEN